jgi:hypothetical protein
VRGTGYLAIVQGPFGNKRNAPVFRVSFGQFGFTKKPKVMKATDFVGILGQFDLPIKMHHIYNAGRGYLNWTNFIDQSLK